jgi:hypothetical protein
MNHRVEVCPIDPRSNVAGGPAAWIVKIAGWSKIIKPKGDKFV